jgi:hypothetical protein
LVSAALMKSLLVVMATMWGVRELNRIEPKKKETDDVGGQYPSAPDTPVSVFSDPECPYECMYPIEDAQHDISAELEDAFTVWRGTDAVDGPALVRYSQEKSAFLYWADVQPNWPALEAMARQYVKEHRCRDLYVTPGTIVSTKTDDSAATDSAASDSTNTKPADEPAEQPSANGAQENEEPTVVSKPSNNYIRMGRLHMFHAPARGGKGDSNLTYGRFKAASGTGYFQGSGGC